jgi:hypothetical protein
MMDDTERSEREPAGRAEAMILRRHRHRAVPVQFQFLEQAGVALAKSALERFTVSSRHRVRSERCPGTDIVRHANA